MSERRNNSSFLFSDGLGEKRDPKHLQTLEVVWALDSESRTSREFPPSLRESSASAAGVGANDAHAAPGKARLDPRHPTGLSGLGCQTPSVLRRGAELWGREGG